MAIVSHCRTDFGALAVQNDAADISQAVFVLRGVDLGLIITSLVASFGPGYNHVSAAWAPLINGYAKLMILQCSAIIDGPTLYDGAAPIEIGANSLDAAPNFGNNVPSVAQMLLSTYVRYNQPYVNLLDADKSPFRCPPHTCLVVVMSGVFGIVDGAAPTPVAGKVTLEVGGQLVQANQYGSSSFFGQPLR